MYKALLTVLLTLASVFAFALEGFGVFGPVSLDSVDPDLVLIAPNGGEIWRAGSSQNVLWTAFDNHFGPAPLDLYYAVEAQDWRVISESVANTGSFSWVLPWLNSESALVQIRTKDLFGNTVYVQSTAPFTIFAAVPMMPEGLSITVEGGRHILLTWQPVTHNVDGSPVVPDGYRILFGTDPACASSAFSLLDTTTESTFTHENAALDYPRYFYAVQAYTSSTPGLCAGSVSSDTEAPKELDSPVTEDNIYPKKEDK